MPLLIASVVALVLLGPSETLWALMLAGAGSGMVAVVDGVGYDALKRAR